MRRHHTASNVHLRTELVPPQGTQISHLGFPGASGLGTRQWAGPRRRLRGQVLVHLRSGGVAHPAWGRGLRAHIPPRGAESEL